MASDHISAFDCWIFLFVSFIGFSLEERKPISNVTFIWFIDPTPMEQYESHSPHKHGWQRTSTRPSRFSLKKITRMWSNSIKKHKEHYLPFKKIHLGTSTGKLRKSLKTIEKLIEKASCNVLWENSSRKSNRKPKIWFIYS